MNGDDSTADQNLQGTAETVVRGKFIAINVYTKRSERHQINNLSTSQRPRKTTANQSKN